MEADTKEPTRQADGVMVVSAWTLGDSGRLFVRVTMTAQPEQTEESEVWVVDTLDQLHALLDAWFARLQH